ncbi:alpha-protein kinase 2 [Hippoglossus hippoglossus]|uniref:alpha-protein kinase 2 n=1 Tax=Hippoglossus hippoglossus TaxID=8267 RepID=UPI00148E2B99|nr:alpha-protein kinase 2 [Hippoglossus hippoglossus]
MDVSLPDSQTRGLDSISLLHSPALNTLSAGETGTEAAPELSDPADKSSEALTNVYACLPHEKSADSDCLKLSSCSYNVSDCLSLRSEPVPTDDDLRVQAYFGSSETALPLLPHLPHDLNSPPTETFSEFYIEQASSLACPLIQDNTPPQVRSHVSEGLMEPSASEPLTRLSFSCEHIQDAFLLSSSSPHSDSSEGDAAVAPVSDLYIFESETQNLILDPNVYPHEIICPDFEASSQIEEKRTSNVCDSADVLSSTEEQAIVDYESDVGHYAGLRPPAADDCKASLMSVNDVRQWTAGVTGLTPEARRSGSPVELWLDACQYLAGEDTEDVVDRKSHSVIQEGLTVTGDFCFLPGETQESGYNLEGSEVIGWSSEDTRGWGPPVKRWSSVDSWATALSDWTGIITASPDDITTAFTEIGAEIQALTQALAEVNTDSDTEASAQAQFQPNMGIQDQLLEAHNTQESSILFGRGCLSEAAGPELRDRVGSQSAEPLCDFTATTQGAEETEEIQGNHTEPFLSFHSSTGSSSAMLAIDVTAVPLILGSASSTHLDLSQCGRCVNSLETELFISNEDPVILNITEETDLEGADAIKEPSGDGLYEVTHESSISQSHSLVEQYAERICGPSKVNRGGAGSNFLTTRSLTNLHVPGVDRQPGLHVHTHVSPDISPDLDRTCQVAQQGGSPKFIIPLAPLSSSSSLVCRKGSGLEGDQICAQSFLDDNRDLSCDHVQPYVVWQTLHGITGKLSSDGYEERIHKQEHTINFAEKSSPEGQLDLQPCNTSEFFFTERKTIIEEIDDLSRELSNLAVVPADHFVISEKNCVAVITLDFNDPFVSRPIKTVATAVPSEKPELNQKTAEKMPHKSQKHTSEGKTRSKKDKSAGHHHGAQASNKQESLSHHVSAPQTNKQQETHPLTVEKHISENAPAGLEDNEAKLGTEAAAAAEKAPSKPHGKKKKKNGQSTAAPNNVGESPVDEDNGAKPKTAKGRIDMFEAKLGNKVEKAPKGIGHSDGALKKSQQLEAKASQGERPPHLAENKDRQPKKFTSPLKDDVIKRRRLSEDKFGKFVSALESKLPKPDVYIKAKAEEPKADADATRKKAYSEVVKQKITPKEEPKVVQPIQTVSVSGDPQSLCLWCQFSAVFSDYTVTWSREGAVLAEIKRSAGDESRVSLTISNASHKDLGKYQCRLSSLHGSVTLDYLLTYEVLCEIVIPPSPKTASSAPVDMGSEEEDARCCRLIFKEDFLSDQSFGDNHPLSIITEKVHFGEGMHRRAFRTKLRTGQKPLLLPGHSCVLKVHNAISYGTKNNDELIEKNFTLAVEECQVQNTAREYIKAYTAAAQSAEAFGEVPEIIPIYLVHRPSNNIPYATLEEMLIGDFVKYSVKDGKEINLTRRDSEAGQKCCAFQHWVYHNTGGNLLVTDMQGVGMRLTDVGIATCKKGYKGFKGNCSTSFIDQFKALHQCNTYCEILGLKSLQPKAKKPAYAPKPKPQPPAAPKKKTFGPTLKGKS